MRTQYKQFRITSTFLNDKLWSADDKMQNYNNHLVTIVNTETHKKTAFEFWGSIMNPEITTENELMFAFYQMEREAVTVLKIFVLNLAMIRTAGKHTKHLRLAKSH